MPERIPTHPGEILLREFLEPLGIDAGALATHIGVDTEKVSRVLDGGQSVDVRMAWLLAMALGTTPQFWLNLQSAHSLATERPDFTIPPLVTPGSSG